VKPLSFIMPILLCTAICSAADLPRSAPEAQGIPSAVVRAFIDAADKAGGVHSVMLLRHGHVVAEGWWAPYDAASPHMLYSLSKSFTSTAVGLAIAEGKLSLDDPVLKFFPDEAPANPSPNLKSMRVSDLLRMNTGHQSEPPRTTTQPWAKTFLDHPVPFKPGTHFLYNTSATYLCSAIVQKATGATLLDYLRPRLFEPLGIQNPTWETSPQGISTGGFGLSVRTEDIARFGQLYLQRGKWQGKQLVPEAWVDAATARQTSNGSNPLSDWDQGYGYQFWRCRNNAYRGDGAFGQYCVVLPDQDAVLAITGGLKDMQAVMNLVWEHLLPAMAPAPLPENESAARALQDRLKSLTLPPQDGDALRHAAAGRKFLFPPNDHKLESLTLQAAADLAAAPTTLLLTIAGTDYAIPCQRGAWHKSRLPWLGNVASQSLAASGAWTAPDTFTAQLCLYETPYVVTLRLTFAANELRLDAESNVAFGPAREPQLVGKAQ